MNPNVPFGGVGKSGYGRTYGDQGFMTFSNQKAVLVKPNLAFFPFNVALPPYTDFKKKMLLKSLDFMAVP